MIYLDLFLTFFRVGLFTIGGGYAMLPLIQLEVAAHSWMTFSEIIDFIAVSESTPGPFAVNISTYIGMVKGGPAGAACATLGVILPSFLVILLISGAYDRFGSSRMVQGAMRGLRPAVVGLISAALLSIFLDVFFPGGWTMDYSLILSWAVFISAGVLAFRKVHPIALICLAAVVGIAAGYGLGL